MRQRVDDRSQELRRQGEHLLEWINTIYENRDKKDVIKPVSQAGSDFPVLNGHLEPYLGLDALAQQSNPGLISDMDLFGLSSGPIPYNVFKGQSSRG